MLRRSLCALVALTLPLGVAACTGDDADADSGHTHAGGAAVSLPVGDGTEAEEVGYEISDVRLPRRAGRPGEVSFRIDTFRGTPQTAFLTEQTKDLHLYVVRDDLGVFRHLHPTMAGDGTWSAPLTLPSGGDYRVISEFVAEDDGGNGDHVILGRTGTVPGASVAPGADEPDPLVQVAVDRAPGVGRDERLGLVVTDAEDRPVRLETYLGTYAHVTGFHRESGAMVHLHPMTDPAVTEDGSGLTFHSEIEQAGDYLLFVQVRVDGFVHTVPVEMAVT
jgi:hypothetical protein